jgi:hypothetical protein
VRKNAAVGAKEERSSLRDPAFGASAESSSLSPERVRVADVETGYLAAPGLVRGVRDHKALRYNLRAVAHLLDVRIERS